ncbi:pickpocket protein 28-like [Nilaparvata lugens]|uniref:pickpocket protein 28-like n=1 Tax=Nilaparvata lugens TaxID=108931 RepID=UPI00193EC1E3|nr:pickpocket protein 28-like [Nilaparvata lugens]
MTEEGYCFTSNSLNHFDFYHKDGLNSKYRKSLPDAIGWNLEDGYDQSAAVDTYPRRAIGSGMKSGLTILMLARYNDLDYLCRGAVQGFKVTLHNPAEIPRVAERFFRVPLNQEVVLAVKPNMMTTSTNLQYYSPKGRQCFFPHERKLAFYKVYTQRNCEMECLTNYTQRACGCVSYYMPRAKDTPICGSGSKNCTGYAYENMIDEEIQVNLKSEVGSTCNCLQACTSIEYDAETSQATYDWEKQMMAYQENMSDPDLLNSVFSRLTIYYKDAQFITSHRSELYGLADFLAGCGGLLGLTSGFSILSLVEIIYYLTLRLYRNFQKKKKPNDTEMENVGE